MAEKKSQKNTEEHTSVDNYEELNLETKVTVRSIAGWETGFARKFDGVGDIHFTAGGTNRLSRAEIIGQVQTANPLFVGIDGKGGHATLYIDDKATRLEVGFDTNDTEQNMFTDSKLKKLFDIKSLETFKKCFTDEIRTRAEKFAVIEAIKKLRLNDYAKIRFAEEYTGYKVQ